MCVVLELSWVVSALLRDPLFLAGLEVALELAVILADDSLRRVVEAISDVICSLRNVLETIDIVTNEGFAIRSEALHLLRVESPVLNCAVVPLLVFKLQVIIEEVLTLNELSPIPLSNITTL